MPANRGKREAIIERRARVARLYYQRIPMRRIAAMIGISLGQVHADVAAVRKRWQQEMAEDFAKHKADQLAGINERRAEAWRGWRRSLKTAEKRFAKRVNDGGDVREESGRTEEGQSGDPRFLTVLNQLDEREAKLLGLDAPEKHQHAGADGKEIVVKILGGSASMEDL